MLVRRPRMVLDHALTLLLNHLIFTTYYSASIPTSLFFWLVMVGGALIMVPAAEQACVKREMREGLAVIRPPRDEDIELEGLVERED
jgi:protein SYS1